MKIVAYIRVSTERQGRSGLGVEAQRAAIASYAVAHTAQIVSEYLEVESGRDSARPELQKAIQHSRLTGSRLAIARLDRLSRSAAFLLSLRDSGADFVCCDNPHATPLTIGVLALVAQEEAHSISVRTKAALAAAKARGRRLGNPNGAEALRRAGKGNVASRASASARADVRAVDVADTLREVATAGHHTLQAQADELNRRGIITARGGLWHPSSVANVWGRLARLRR